MSAPRNTAHTAVGVAVFLLALGVGMRVSSPEDIQSPPASDQFWHRASVRGMAAEEFGSLEEMAKSADLVVVGRISEVAKGRE